MAEAMMPLNRYDDHTVSLRRRTERVIWTSYGHRKQFKTLREVNVYEALSKKISVYFHQISF